MSEIPIDYPSTHTFNTETYEPTNVMKERIEIIESNFSDFFKGDRLLDCACNKGLISFRYSKMFNEIIGFDVFQDFVDYCNKYNKFDNIKFTKSSFRSFWDTNDFDRVFIGNAHHYFYKEIEGWEWIDKLATLVRKNGLVLIEGPVDMKCKDMERVMTTEKLASGFTEKNFMDNMGKYFKLIKKIPTVKGTPDRYFLLFKRNEDNLNKTISVKGLTLKKVFKYLTRVVLISLVEKNRVAKILMTPPDINQSVRLFMRMASLSPISNGMEAELIDEERNYCGWIEKYSSNKIYKDGENQNNVFKLHCENQIYLSKVGFFDLDPATINFFKGCGKNFDKGAVVPIEHLVDVHWKIPGGTYFKIIDRGYNKINSDKLKSKISNAMASKDPEKIKKCFEEIKNEL